MRMDSGLEKRFACSYDHADGLLGKIVFRVFMILSQDVKMTVI